MDKQLFGLMAGHPYFCSSSLGEMLGHLILEHTHCCPFLAFVTIAHRQKSDATKSSSLTHHNPKSALIRSHFLTSICPLNQNEEELAKWFCGKIICLLSRD